MDNNIEQGRQKLINLGFTDKEIKNFEAVNLRVKMIENGHVIYTFPSIEETRKKVQLELSTLWEEALRLENPHTYTVNLSDKLTKVKEDLLHGTHTEI